MNIKTKNLDLPKKEKRTKSIHYVNELEYLCLLNKKSLNSFVKKNKLNINIEFISVK